MKLPHYLAAFTLVLPALVYAQPTTDTNDSHWLLPITELQADDKIPTSEQALRYKWADEVSSHHQIETYLRRLAHAAPDRTKLVQYGQSYEGRSLNYLVVSSPENIARLNEIQRNNLKLADPRTCDDISARPLISALPKN